MKTIIFTLIFLFLSLTISAEPWEYEAFGIIEGDCPLMYLIDFVIIICVIMIIIGCVVVLFMPNKKNEKENWLDKRRTK